MPYRWLRRMTQIAVFALFVFLFLNTEYKDNDVLPYAVNIFLRLDPLVAGAATLAGRAVIGLLWPALVLLLLTLLFGRFFCGWICPLGTLLDGVSALRGRQHNVRSGLETLKKVKYLLLAFLAVSALFSLQLVFLFDPISILIRSLAVALYPALNLALNSTFHGLYATEVKPLLVVSEPAYAFLKNHFLAFEQPFFMTAVLSGVIFVGILLLEVVQRRFWCRYLCPLGALFGLVGRYSLLRRRVTAEGCNNCQLCVRDCRSGAIAADPLGTDRRECLVCQDCVDLCPQQAIAFRPAVSTECAGSAPERRQLLMAAGAGALIVPFFGVEAHAKTGDPRRIRPPGALPENEFLARCTRCGECMRVCIANGLQPALFEAGLAGVWSPVLVPRLGYCEYNCTLCGQVCPTGAIRRLPVLEKQKIRIGLADVDRSRCLPWKGDSECIVCEEHCPTPEKAIILREEEVWSVEAGGMITVKRPYVDEKRCIGCGICETRCPLTDRSAIVVSCRGESRAELS